jgi:hypothetical protein
LSRCSRQDAGAAARRLDLLSSRARRALVRADLAAAEKALAASMAEIDKTVGSLVTGTVARGHLSKLLKSVRAQRVWIEERLVSLGAVDAKTRWFAKALSCDRVRADRHMPGSSNTCAEGLRVSGSMCIRLKCSRKSMPSVGRYILVAGHDEGHPLLGSCRPR